MTLSRLSASPYSIISSARTPDRHVPALIRPSGKHRVLATLLAELQRWTWVVQVAGITPERARRPEHQALGCG